MSKLTDIKEELQKIEGSSYTYVFASRYKTHITYLLSLLEEKDKALEWANRIIGSGLDIGAELRYDPRQWLIDYHTSSNNEGES